MTKGIKMWVLQVKHDLACDSNFKYQVSIIETKFEFKKG